MSSTVHRVLQGPPCPRAVRHCGGGGGVLIIVLRGPYLCWARSERSGQHLDSGRIFCYGWSFTTYSALQKVHAIVNIILKSEILGDQLANRNHRCPPALGRQKGPGAHSKCLLLPQSLVQAFIIYSGSHILNS